MNLHVRVHRAFLLVSLSTELAAVWFLPSVRQHMSFQVDLLDKAFAAELAAEWLLLLVEPFVRLKRDLLAEPLPTEAADERLLACVDPHVGVQVANLAEVFPTLSTGVWFLSSVDPLVHIQVLAHGELLAADVAGVDPGFPSRVTLYVPLQDSVFNESLPAELADVRPLTGMKLHVSLKRAFPGKVLAAVFAPEGFLAGVRPHVDLHVPEADATDVADPAGFSVALDVKLQTL